MDTSRILRVSLLISVFASLLGAEAVGVDYGMLGDNLPTPSQVVALYKSRNIPLMRLYGPNSNALTALGNSGIGLILGVNNQDLQSLATDATRWVITNVVPYANSVKIRYIAAGNEVPDNQMSYVLPAMQNLDRALKAVNLQIPVSTAVAFSVVGVSYPPSAGSFANPSTIGPIVSYLQANGRPLLANVYPYFTYASNSVSLEYATFTSNGVVVQDGSHGYTNLFDAQLDALYSALEKVGGSSIAVVVSESGWPSGGGGVGATVENAMTYNNNLVAHVNSNAGTPKRPGKAIETYIFAMFNEDQKPAGTEQHFGLYNPDMTEVYHVNF